MPAPTGAMANDINTVGFSGPLPDERTVRVDPHRVTIGGGATFGDVQVPLIWGLNLCGLSGHIFRDTSESQCVLWAAAPWQLMYVGALFPLVGIACPLWQNSTGHAQLKRSCDRDHAARGWLPYDGESVVQDRTPFELPLQLPDFLEALPAALGRKWSPEPGLAATAATSGTSNGFPNASASSSSDHLPESASTSELLGNTVSSGKRTDSRIYFRFALTKQQPDLASRADTRWRMCQRC